MPWRLFALTVLFLHTDKRKHTWCLGFGMPDLFIQSVFCYGVLCNILITGPSLIRQNKTKKRFSDSVTFIQRPMFKPLWMTTSCFPAEGLFAAGLALCFWPPALWPPGGGEQVKKTVFPFGIDMRSLKTSLVQLDNIQVCRTRSMKALHVV